MQQKTSQILYAYWNEVRGGRLAPRRFDIEPGAIAGILPETFILERVDSRTAQFRLAGTRICEHFGNDLRGRNFLDLWRDADRTELEHDLATAADRGGVVVITFEASRQNGDRARFELLMLPLLHTRPIVTRYLGTISAVETPYWLGSEPLTIGRIIRRDTLWPDGRPHQTMTRASRQSPLMPAMSGARVVRVDKRQFRVLEGGAGLQVKR